MATVNNYWERLLVAWRSIGRDGLTIPYLIGSQIYLPSKNIKQDIQGLLIDIVQSDGNPVYITYCMDINEIILGIRDHSKMRIAGHFPPLHGDDQQKIFLTNGVVNLGDTVESIAMALKARYQEMIDNEHFSKRGGEWGDYSASEKEFIKGCF